MTFNQWPKNLSVTLLTYLQANHRRSKLFNELSKQKLNEAESFSPLSQLHFELGGNLSKNLVDGSYKSLLYPLQIYANLTYF